MKPCRFVYSFVVRPVSEGRGDWAVVQLFNVLADRIALDFTEVQFERFRASLADFGLALHEVERVPYVEPEPVL